MPRLTVLLVTEWDVSKMADVCSCLHPNQIVINCKSFSRTQMVLMKKRTTNLSFRTIRILGKFFLSRVFAGHRHISITAIFAVPHPVPHRMLTKIILVNGFLNLVSSFVQSIELCYGFRQQKLTFAHDNWWNLQSQSNM